jgi:hypothetical protein
MSLLFMLTLSSGGTRGADLGAVRFPGPLEHRWNYSRKISILGHLTVSKNLKKSILFKLAPRYIINFEVV